MNTGEWIKALGIPKDAVIDRNFPKKMLYQNATLSSSQKDLVQNGIKRLRWLGSIKESNTNVSKYEDDNYCYEEIQYFFIEVNSQDSASKICKLLFDYMPYPQFLIVTFEEEFQFQMALTRKNSADTNSLVVEKIYTSQWKSIGSAVVREELIQYHYSTQKMINLKEYYESLLAALLRNTFSFSKGKTYENAEKIIQTFDKIQELEIKIEKLIKLVKSEKQLNKRIELQMQLTQLKNHQKNLILATEEIEHV